LHPRFGTKELHVKTAKTISSVILWVAPLLLLAGCGGEPDNGMRPLAGVVMLDGQPLVGADITFFNEQHTYGMMTLSEGKFDIPGGALPGTYKVTISKLKGLDQIPEGIAVAPSATANPETLTADFSNPRRTKLTYTHPPEGHRDVRFNVESKAPRK
jgi:hypothetical protein